MKGMRWGRAGSVGLISVSLVFSGSSAVAVPQPTPPTATVSKGTYFSKTFRTRLSVARNGWVPQRIVVRGSGVRRVLRGKSRTLRLAPGRYRVTVDYREELPAKKGSLSRLRKQGAAISWDGSVQPVSVVDETKWVWDSTIAPNKGVYYRDGFIDPAVVQAYALDLGASVEGRLACLHDYGDLGYDTDSGSVAVAQDDPRLFKPPPESTWLAWPYGPEPDEPGQRNWKPTGNTAFRACSTSYYAFKADQVPADYSWDPIDNYWKWVLRLPDGDWVGHTETRVVGKKWVGTVTAVLPDGSTYQSPVESLEYEIGDPEFPRVRLTLQSGTAPKLKSAQVTGKVRVRAVNAKWPSRGEVKAIKIGMSKAEVFRIIGSAGSLEVKAAGLEVRQWWSGYSVTIGFRGGRVASIVY